MARVKKTTDTTENKKVSSKKSTKKTTPCKKEVVKNEPEVLPQIDIEEEKELPIEEAKRTFEKIELVQVPKQEGKEEKVTTIKEKVQSFKNYFKDTKYTFGYTWNGMSF